MNLRTLARSSGGKTWAWSCQTPRDRRPPRRTAPGASPSSTGTGGGTARRSRRGRGQHRGEVVALVRLEVGQPGRRALRRRASRTARPPRTGRRPASRRLVDHPRAARFLADVVEQQPAPRAAVMVALGGVLLGGHRPAGPTRPRSGRADAGSRRPSRRPGSRTPGPSGSAPRARSVWSAHRSMTRRTSRCCHGGRGPGHGAARSTRRGTSPRSPSARSSPSRTTPSACRGWSARSRW